MSIEFVSITWFDALPVVSTFLTVLLIQFLNATFVNKTETLTNTAATTTATTTTPSNTTTATNFNFNTTNVTTTNGGCEKRKSEISEAVSTPTSPVNSSPLSYARNSISSPINGSIPTTQNPFNSDTLSDEYHEDEDTLSLENLFPCDQSEIYESKKISFIIDELIQTEANYVTNLQKGLKNYGNLHERDDLPEALQDADKQKQLLGNVRQILELHEKKILPLMLRNQHDLKTLFDEFSTFIDKNQFYCYVIFMMNKKASMQLRQSQREWFERVQTEIKDKLGIDSFLVQPVQRLTRYPLLLQQFISEFYKSGISCRPVLVSLCKLETRMRRLLQVFNQAEEIPNIEELNEELIRNQGDFRRSTEFDVYHYRSRKKYRAKIFLFENCLLCAEVRKRRLTYRQHYPWESLTLQLNSSKSIKLILKATNESSEAKDEFELAAPEAISVTQWLRCAQSIVNSARIQALQKDKYSVPMDFVLVVLLGIWLIWQYL